MASHTTKRSPGYSSLLTAAVLTTSASLIQQQRTPSLPFVDVTVELRIVKAFYGVAVVAGAYGLYLLVGNATSIASRTSVASTTCETVSDWRSESRRPSRSSEY